MTANRWTLTHWTRWDRGRPDPVNPGGRTVPGGLRIIRNGYPEGWTLWQAEPLSPPEWMKRARWALGKAKKPGRIDTPPEPLENHGPWRPAPWPETGIAGGRGRMMLDRGWPTNDPGWSFEVEPEAWATATPAEIVGLLGELWGPYPFAVGRGEDYRGPRWMPQTLAGELARDAVGADDLDLTEESPRRAVALLTGELAGLLGELRESLELTPEGLAKLWTPADGWRTDDGMLWIEARMIAEIRQRFGARALANDFGDAYRERWTEDGNTPARLLRGWLNPERWAGDPGSGWASPAGWLPFLAGLLWQHSTGPAWARQLEAEERARKNAPGLPLPVHTELGDSLVAAIHDDYGRIVRKSDRRQLPLRFAAVDASALDAVPLNALGKLTAHRLVRWMIQAAHAGHFLTTDNAVKLVDGVTARRGATGVDLVVVGGLSRLAEVVGAGSKKAPGDLRDALNVLSQVTLQWSAPGSEGGGSLVSWRGPGSGGAHPSQGTRSVVRITVSDVLCPGMGARLRGSSDALVVPVLDVPVMPDGVSPRVHAPLARFDWMVTREMVARSREAVGSGGVVLNLDTIGKDAGLKRKHVEAAEAAWIVDSDTAPARWERNGSRYMLADRPPTADARRWILEGAEMREGRSKGGRESGRRRRMKLEGKTTPRK